MIRPTERPARAAEDITRFCRETWEAVEVDISRYADAASAYKTYKKVLQRLRDQGSAGNIEIMTKGGRVYLVKPGEAYWDEDEPEEDAGKAAAPCAEGSGSLIGQLQEIQKLRMDVAERLPDAGPATRRKLLALDKELAKEEERLNETIFSMEPATE